ncbi:MAG TPA: ferredoxin [Opitutae bacterium]|nr:ferredoxin [Opitutae bacterium]|tara:strand:+ start:1506 stop:3212 length:1707 start_codon:yes stop_codon:yes gene_type:complete
MISEKQKEAVTINLDGKEVEVPAGVNLIEAAALHGKEIPHYCYHPQLSVAGNCRMCLVEMGTPMRDRGSGEPILEEDGSPKIGWVPKPVIGCATDVIPGMHVKTESETVLDCRESIMEFLLVNHPLDCPICDQAGECRLQEFATDYGRGYSRYEERKNVKPKRTRLGPRVTLDDERCILCSRCIRFCQEVADDDVLGFVDRGSFSTLTCFPGRELSNNYSLNTVDLCPVGALTSSDFRFKMRVWFLKETPSICPESSAGCNTLVSSREGEIYRITPKRNDLVNDSWMPDSGRSLYKEVRSEHRLTKPRTDGEDCSLEDALGAAVAALSVKHVGIVGSCRSSLEEQFLANQLAKGIKAKKFLRGHFGDDDGILLSSDRTPNLRGTLLSGFASAYPKDNFSSLALALKKGSLDALVVMGEDLLESKVDADLLKGIPIIFLGTHENATSQLAKVVLPTLTSFEKSGSFVNRSFILQAFRQSVPGPAGLLPDVKLLSRLLNELVEESSQGSDLDEIWEDMARPASSPLKSLCFSDLKKGCVQLDGSKWASLPFVEKKALHYKPASPKAAKSS